MKSLLLAALLLPSVVCARDYTVDPDASWLRFTASAQGEAFTGQFSRFTVQLAFDPEQPGQARFDVQIDLASADTGSAERDDTLRGEDFFAVARAPNAFWRAQGAVALGEGRYRADGNLTLRGVTRAAPLTFRWSEVDGHAQLEGEASLDRLDFNVGAGDWGDTEVVAARVAVTTRLQLQSTP